MAGRGDEPEAEPLDVVEGVAEGMNLEFATVARAGVDVPDREAATKGVFGRLFHGRRQRGKLRILGSGRALRQRRTQALQRAVLRILEVAPRIGAIERFVAEREVGDDVALDRRLQQRPLEPRGVAQMAARDGAVVREPHMREDVAAKALDEGKALACASR